MLVSLQTSPRLLKQASDEKIMGQVIEIWLEFN